MTNVHQVRTRLCGFRLLAAALLFSAATVSLNALPVLHQVAEIRKLTAAEARQAFPVSLHGVVTYFDNLGPDLFFQDESGGIWIKWTEGQAKPQKGQTIQLEGVTAQVDFAPDIAEPRFRKGRAKRCSPRGE